MKNIETVHYSDTLSIRCILENDEWWCAIEDFIKILTDSPAPHLYWKSLKYHIQNSNSQSASLIALRSLDLIVVDIGKKSLDFTNTKGILCILKNTPAAKTEKILEWFNSLDLLSKGEIQ